MFEQVQLGYPPNRIAGYLTKESFLGMSDGSVMFKSGSVMFKSSAFRWMLYTGQTVNALSASQVRFMEPVLDPLEPKITAFSR